MENYMAREVEGDEIRRKKIASNSCVYIIFCAIYGTSLQIKSAHLLDGSEHATIN